MEFPTLDCEGSFYDLLRILFEFLCLLVYCGISIFKYFLSVQFVDLLYFIDTWNFLGCFRFWLVGINFILVIFTRGFFCHV